jgi:hypothetical protein
MVDWKIEKTKDYIKILKSFTEVTCFLQIFFIFRPLTYFTTRPQLLQLPRLPQLQLPTETTETEILPNETERRTDLTCADTNRLKFKQFVDTNKTKLSLKEH